MEVRGVFSAHHNALILLAIHPCLDHVWYMFFQPQANLGLSSAQTTLKTPLLHPRIHFARPEPKMFSHFVNWKAVKSRFARPFVNCLLGNIEKLYYPRNIYKRLDLNFRRRQHGSCSFSLDGYVIETHHTRFFVAWATNLASIPCESRIPHGQG